jgi:type I restriction enzyme R subunit
MIEFKQIIGRGTRLFDGKDYFTIYDFVKAYEHFNDREWDGEPDEPVPLRPRGGEGPAPPPGGDDDDRGPEGGEEGPLVRQRIKIKLADG